MNPNETSITYVVFKGRKPGVYTSWIDTHAHVHNFKDALFNFYDTIEEGRMAWSSYEQYCNTSKQSPHTSKKVVGTYFGTTTTMETSMFSTTSVGIIKSNIQHLLGHVCHTMRVPEPTYTLQEEKFINGQRHYKYYASLICNTIGRPPVSMGRYAPIMEDAREDVVVCLLRRLLAGNGRRILDYNHRNVVLLEKKLEEVMAQNLELQMLNATLTKELRILKSTNP
ncbi:Ribosomal protein L9/RNase H1, N-terminal [Sesbania bispinosa]|nr:Ribosomal protein L9/RNase H1, N-terminal [Sesbania bispinosa]